MYNGFGMSLHLGYIAESSTQSWTDGSAFKVLLPIATAILGFFSSYTLEVLRRKRDPRKQISWDLETETGVVAVSPSVRERVQVLYRDNVVDNLHSIRFTVRNTGNRVVRNQFIRFEFNPRTAVLESSLDPAPVREIGVSRVEDVGLTANEIRYKIEHIECGQQVSFVFLAAGEEVDAPIPHPFNEGGDVQFIQRDVARVTADIEHVRPFFLLSLLFIVLPPMFEGFVIADGELGQILSLIIRGAILIAALPHVPAMAHLAHRIIARVLNDREGGNVAVSGDALVMLGQNAEINGDVSFRGANSKAENPRGHE